MNDSVDPLEAHGFVLPQTPETLSCVKLVWPALDCYGAFVGARNDIELTTVPGPGGALKSMYRAGKTADCSGSWTNLRTCLRVKAEKAPERQIVRHRQVRNDAQTQQCAGDFA